MNKKTNYPLNRRGFLGSAAAGAAVFIGGSVKAADHQPSRAKRALRLAHMTDTHVEAKRSADKGFAAALQHMHNLTDAPELLVLGGDVIMDSLARDDAATEAQWNLVHQMLKAHCRIPVKACLGNHDIWGWDKAESKTTGAEPLWGKARGVQELKMPRRHYSFEQAGWRFIMLDATFDAPDHPHTYVVQLDDEQFGWLETTLAGANADQPVIIFSHEPIVSIAALQYAKTENYQPTLNAMSILADFRRVWDLFRKHPNVKLCLSGHLHLVDRAQFAGVTYICDGAVSGAWWKGDHYDCDEGYGVVDLYADGTFEHQYVSYGWTPVA